jgi:endonuclease YncB( thermonuclease family)
MRISRLGSLLLLAVLALPAEAGPVRDVSPPGVTIPVRPGDWSNRKPVEVAPVAPPVVVEPPQNIVVLPGRITVDQVPVTIEGAEPIEATLICKGADSARWACGQRALMAWRQYLSSGARCTVDQGKARCVKNNGGVEIWLLTNGWARTVQGETDANRLAAAREAVTRQRGIYARLAPPSP